MCPKKCYDFKMLAKIMMNLFMAFENVKETRNINYV
jgi:hypothetical protein